MDSNKSIRRKFKPIIDDKHIKEMFSRKRVKCDTKKKIEKYEEVMPIVLENIPNEMIPTLEKHNKPKVRVIKNHDHWAKPVSERRSRDDNFKSEESNINKMINRTKLRSAQILSLTRQPKAPEQFRIDEI